MGRGRRGEVSAETKKVREGVDRWRKTRKMRSPMPEDLWAAAVVLARTHGVYRISEDLGVNYDTLKARLARAPKVSAAEAQASKSSGGRKRQSVSEAPARFVELRAMPAQAAPDVRVVVEVQDAAGAKLTIRLGAEATVDVCAVVTAFRGEGLQAKRRRGAER